MKALYTNLKQENFEMLELLSNLKGIKKNHIINEALENYFNTIKTIPEEFLLQQIAISQTEFERLEQNTQATKALKKLLNEN
jgi:predicted DNA-binding protein